MESKAYKRRYRLNWRKFATNIITPTQFAIGLLLIIGTVGAMEMQDIPLGQYMAQCAIGYLLMAGVVGQINH